MHDECSSDDGSRSSSPIAGRQTANPVEKTDGTMTEHEEAKDRKQEEGRGGEERQRRKRKRGPGSAVLECVEAAAPELLAPPSNIHHGEEEEAKRPRRRPGVFDCVEVAAADPPPAPLPSSPRSSSPPPAATPDAAMAATATITNEQPRKAHSVSSKTKSISEEKEEEAPPHEEMERQAEEPPPSKPTAAAAGTQNSSAPPPTIVASKKKKAPSETGDVLLRAKKSLAPSAITPKMKASSKTASDDTAATSISSTETRLTAEDASKRFQDHRPAANTAGRPIARSTTTTGPAPSMKTPPSPPTTAAGAATATATAASTNTKDLLARFSPPAASAAAVSQTTTKKRKETIEKKEQHVPQKPKHRLMSHNAAAAAARQEEERRRMAAEAARKSIEKVDRETANHRRQREEEAAEAAFKRAEKAAREAVHRRRREEEEAAAAAAARKGEEEEVRRRAAADAQVRLQLAAARLERIMAASGAPSAPAAKGTSPPADATTAIAGFEDAEAADDEDEALLEMDRIVNRNFIMHQVHVGIKEAAIDTIQKAAVELLSSGMGTVPHNKKKKKKMMKKGGGDVVPTLTVQLPEECGFPCTLNAPFPDHGKVPVCVPCKRVYRSKRICRIVSRHRELPWTTTYLCFTLGETCTVRTDDGDGDDADSKGASKQRYVEGPFEAEYVEDAFDRYVYHGDGTRNSSQNNDATAAIAAKTRKTKAKKGKGGDKDDKAEPPRQRSICIEPICSDCKGKNYTREYCRDKLKHLGLPWSTAYFRLSAATDMKGQVPAEVVPSVDASADMATGTKKRHPKKERAEKKEAPVAAAGTKKRPYTRKMEKEARERSDGRQDSTKTKGRDINNDTNKSPNARKAKFGAPDKISASADAKGEVSKTTTASSSTSSSSTSTASAPGEGKQQSSNEKEVKHRAPKSGGAFNEDLAVIPPSMKHRASKPGGESNDDLTVIPPSRTFLVAISADGCVVKWVDHNLTTDRNLTTKKTDRIFSALNDMAADFAPLMHIDPQDSTLLHSATPETVPPASSCTTQDQVTIGEKEQPVPPSTHCNSQRGELENKTYKSSSLVANEELIAAADVPCPVNPQGATPLANGLAGAHESATNGEGMNGHYRNKPGPESAHSEKSGPMDHSDVQSSFENQTEIRYKLDALADQTKIPLNPFVNNKLDALAAIADGMANSSDLTVTSPVLPQGLTPESTGMLGAEESVNAGTSSSYERNKAEPMSIQSPPIGGGNLNGTECMHLPVQLGRTIYQRKYEVLLRRSSMPGVGFGLIMSEASDGTKCLIRGLHPRIAASDSCSVELKTIRPGDVVVGVNGEDASQWSFDHIAFAMKNAPDNFPLRLQLARTVMRTAFGSRPRHDRAIPSSANKIVASALQRDSNANTRKSARASEAETDFAPGSPEPRCSSTLDMSSKFTAEPDPNEAVEQSFCDDPIYRAVYHSTAAASGHLLAGSARDSHERDGPTQAGNQGMSHDVSHRERGRFVGSALTAQDAANRFAALKENAASQSAKLRRVENATRGDSSASGACQELSQQSAPPNSVSFHEKIRMVWDLKYRREMAKRTNLQKRPDVMNSRSKRQPEALKRAEQPVSTPVRIAQARAVAGYTPPTATDVAKAGAKAKAKAKVRAIASRRARMAKERAIVARAVARARATDGCVAPLPGTQRVNIQSSQAASIKKPSRLAPKKRYLLDRTGDQTVKKRRSMPEPLPKTQQVGRTSPPTAAKNNPSAAMQQYGPCQAAKNIPSSTGYLPPAKSEKMAEAHLTLAASRAMSLEKRRKNATASLDEDSLGTQPVDVDNYLAMLARPPRAAQKKVAPARHVVDSSGIRRACGRSLPFVRNNTSPAIAMQSARSKRIGNTQLATARMKALHERRKQIREQRIAAKNARINVLQERRIKNRREEILREKRNAAKLNSLEGSDGIRLRSY